MRALTSPGTGRQSCLCAYLAVPRLLCLDQPSAALRTFPCFVYLGGAFQKALDAPRLLIGSSSDFCLVSLRGQPLSTSSYRCPCAQRDLGSALSAAVQAQADAQLLYLNGPEQRYLIPCLASPSASSSHCPCASNGPWPCHQHRSPGHS
jgi:hypothetical protein